MGRPPRPGHQRLQGHGAEELLQAEPRAHEGGEGRLGQGDGPGDKLSTLAVTGGWGGIAKFGYVKTDVTRIDQKSANLTMNERVTVKRSIYPQATLKGLGRLLRRCRRPSASARFIQEVTLDDEWFTSAP